MTPVLSRISIGVTNEFGSSPAELFEDRSLPVSKRWSKGDPAPGGRARRHSYASSEHPIVSGSDLDSRLFQVLVKMATNLDEWRGMFVQIDVIMHERELGSTEVVLSPRTLESLVRLGATLHVETYCSPP